MVHNLTPCSDANPKAKLGEGDPKYISPKYDRPTFDHTNKFNTAAEDVERPVTPPNAEADAFKSESSTIQPRERNVRGTMYCTRGVNWDPGMMAYQHDLTFDRMEKFISCGGQMEIIMKSMMILSLNHIIGYT